VKLLRRQVFELLWDKWPKYLSEKTACSCSI